jgi:hypothetical protein
MFDFFSNHSVFFFICIAFVMFGFGGSSDTDEDDDWDQVLADPNNPAGACYEGDY